MPSARDRGARAFAAAVLAARPDARSQVGECHWHAVRLANYRNRGRDIIHRG
jgi:hypothetical protein